MKKVLSLFLASMLVMSSAFARAGSSHRSSGSTSHSSGYSMSKYHSAPAPTRTYQSAPAAAPSHNYNWQTKSATAKPTSVATAPIAPKAQPAATHAASAPAATHTPTASAGTTHTTVNKTVVVHKNYGSNGYNNRGYDNGYNNNGGGFGGNGGGMGIGGTIAGVAGGIVVGSLLTDALMHDKHNAAYVPAGGYVSNAQGVPAAGQPVAPQMAGATEGNYVTDGKGGVMPAPVASEPQAAGSVAQPAPSGESSMAPMPMSGEPTAEAKHESGWKTFWTILFYIVTGIIVLIILVKLYSLWKLRRDVKMAEKEFENQEARLDLFSKMFIETQMAYSIDDKAKLRQFCTPDQYQRFELIKHDNIEELGDGYTNIVSDIKVINIVTQNTRGSENIMIHTVKINFSMIDYVVNNEGEVTHGSKDEAVVDSEIWQFMSKDFGKTWKLDRVL